ncbi:MAG TPA: hypothetical protein VFP84_26135 [Kofleriaceae bacterium]|nr:hypothetical protein [Kofleriaceae bacterium]
MTDQDPSSPAAWAQAQAIAATVAKGPVQKRSDALPFLFTAASPPVILVHRGAVVRGTGAKVVGEYLRDLGIIEGKGPQIEDALFVLRALDALPPVTDVPRDSFVHAPGDAKLADLTASLYADGLFAQIQLTYLVGQPVWPKSGNGPAGPGDTVGSKDPDFKPKMIQPILRATLMIQKSGDPAWKLERLNTDVRK